MSLNNKVYSDIAVRQNSCSHWEPLPQRRRYVLQRRSVPVDVASPATELGIGHSEDERSIEMTQDAYLKKISKDLKEFFAVRNLEEG